MFKGGSSFRARGGSNSRGQGIVLKGLKHKGVYNVKLFSKRNHNSDSYVLFQSVNNAGLMIINRPKELNCLNRSMVTSMINNLKTLESTNSLVIAKGVGGKAFCAGGDVKACSDAVEGPKYFFNEYNAIYLISKFKIPYVSLIDGYTMGAGLGISVPGKFRIATENTVVAMPENKIGLCPDVGGTYFLPRLKYRVGYYLGLTGETLKGFDALEAGLATHFIPSKYLDEVENMLTHCKTESDINDVLQKFNVTSGEYSLRLHLEHINSCFSASTVEEIIKNLEIVNSSWCHKTIEALHNVCPGSLKVTLRALQCGASLSLKDCLKMEYRLTCRATEYNDFREGVRARLVDKDQNPKWNPRTLMEVKDDYVNSFFKEMPHGCEFQVIV